jgi:hypothetical protein
MVSNGVYSVLVFVHVLAASVLLGSSLMFPLTRRAIRAARTVEELRGWLAFARSSAAANPLSAMVLLATGVFLGWEGGWWRGGWFQVAVALFVVNGFYAARKAEGAGAELGKAAATTPSGPISEAVDEIRWSARLDLPTDLLLANDVAALFIMFTKPGLLGASAAVLAANAVLLVIRRRRRSTRPAATADAAVGPTPAVA